MKDEKLKSFYAGLFSNEDNESQIRTTQRTNLNSDCSRIFKDILEVPKDDIKYLSLIDNERDSKYEGEGAEQTLKIPISFFQRKRRNLSEADNSKFKAKFPDFEDQKFQR